MRVLAPGIDSLTPGTKGGRQHDLPARIVADRLGGILHQIQEHLNELVAVRQHRRQRRIVLLDKLDVASDAGLRQTLHVIEHHVNIDRFAFDWTLVGEYLHAIDQLHNAIGFVADQPCKGAVIVANRLFQQLRRAADARERILDFVRKHGGERDH